MTSCLVLGGARSGKSSYAQSFAESARSRQIYVATAEALDKEMEDRIARHVSDRGDSWITVEESLDLCSAIATNADSDKAVVVDCLTLWLSNLMHAELDVDLETEKLARAVHECKTPLILVSNEVGMGIVPESVLGRDFRDAQGFLNKAIAEVCDQVYFVAAGLPLRLKPSPENLAL